VISGREKQHPIYRDICVASTARNGLRGVRPCVVVGVGESSGGCVRVVEYRGDREGLPVGLLVLCPVVWTAAVWYVFVYECAVCVCCALYIYESIQFERERGRVALSVE